MATAAAPSHCAAVYRPQQPGTVSISAVAQRQAAAAQFDFIVFTDQADYRLQLDACRDDASVITVLNAGRYETFVSADKFARSFEATALQWRARVEAGLLLEPHARLVCHLGMTSGTTKLLYRSEDDGGRIDWVVIECIMRSYIDRFRSL